jgi:hypothetical protein
MWMQKTKLTRKIMGNLVRLLMVMAVSIGATGTCRATVDLQTHGQTLGRIKNELSLLTPAELKENHGLLATILQELKTALRQTTDKDAIKKYKAFRTKIVALYRQIEDRQRAFKKGKTLPKIEKTPKDFAHGSPSTEREEDQEKGGGLQLMRVPSQEVSQQPSTSLETSPQPPSSSQGLFVVEGKVIKQKRFVSQRRGGGRKKAVKAGFKWQAKIVRILHVPDNWEETEDIPEALQKGVYLYLPEDTHMNTYENKRSSGIKSALWHKLVDKRVEILVTPEGEVQSWKEIGTARRMMRGVKKFFGQTAVHTGHRATLEPEEEEEEEEEE